MNVNMKKLVKQLAKRGIRIIDMRPRMWDVIDSDGLRKRLLFRDNKVYVLVRP